MGGNVFKKTHEVIRLNKSQYEEVCKEFEREFGHWLDYDELYSYADWEIIPSYRNKQDFGDMDVLYTNYNFCSKAERVLSEAGIKTFKRNSNVVSFLYDPLGYGNFQVDLIYMEPKHYQSSLQYYSYNDLGNLRGRIAHLLGLKLGHEGLSYIHKEGDRVCFEIPLSKDLYEIEEFLGFDKYKTFKFYEKGPKELEDIFEYVASSKYFNPEIYLLQNRNHVSRVRDKKRKTYMEFLKYCEKLPKDREYFQRPEHKGFYRLHAIETFNKKHTLIMELTRLEKDRIIKSKFNGEIVMRITGLNGKELGNFMSDFRQKVPTQLFEVLEKETIEQIIKDFYKSWTQS